MDFKEPRQLGRTGVRVGRLGVAGGYGAPAAALEEAFERGCNYFYWGSFRRSGMAQAIRNLCGRGQRERLIVVVQVYNRLAGMLEWSVDRALRKLKLDYADVLLLGWYNAMPGPRILEAAQNLRARKKVRFLAVSGHHRPAFPVMAATGVFDIIHVRYNAAHRGAEADVFPKLPSADRPGVVTYTATRWGQLLKTRNMPAGERTPRASDCYRFVLSRPEVDVCVTGPKNREEMQEALRALEAGPLSEAELAWMRRVGDHVRARGWF